MSHIGYRIELTPDDNGTFLVTSPDFPELTTFGEDEADALTNAISALEEAIAARIAHKDQIPEVQEVREGRAILPSVQASLAIAIHQAMLELKWSKAELARRLSWHRPQVDRLLDPRHPSQADKFQSALAVMGKRVEVRLVNAA